MRSTPFSIAEQDSSPTVWQPWQIQFPNGTVTNNGNGTVFINTGAAGAGETLEARTPLLKAGTILSLNTDGTTANFLRGDGTWAVPAGGETLEARTPLLKAGSILSLNTDGLTTTYLRGDGTYRSVYEARSPLLSAGTILSIITDGTTTNFLRGDSVYAVPASNSGIKIILFTVYSSQSWTGEAISIGQAPFETPITIKQVNVTTSGSSPTVAFNIEHRAWGSIGISGTPLFSVNQTATTSGFEGISFTSANFAAKSHIFLTTSAITIGQMDYITGSIYYTRNSI